MTSDIHPAIFAAPLQGYTDAAWRRFHSELFPGSVDSYTTPFLRIEKGEVRRQDMKALTSDLNEGVALTPQIIFRDADEFRRLADAVARAGYGRTDLNLGCPFPPQVKHGRGSALIRRPEILAGISRLIEEEPYAGMEFSVKMRLGVERPDEWEEIIEILNGMRLSHLTVHPRVAADGYTGELNMGEFGRLAARSAHPIVFNGDILSAGDFETIAGMYPGLKGIMIGRGLLAMPSLAAEIREGRLRTDAERLESLRRLHDRLYAHYRDILCGDTQLLSKIKPFWDYAEPLIGHKAAKAIRKATSRAKYEAAVGLIS